MQCRDISQQLPSFDIGDEDPLSFIQILSEEIRDIISKLNTVLEGFCQVVKKVLIVQARSNRRKYREQSASPSIFFLQICYSLYLLWKYKLTILLDPPILSGPFTLNNDATCLF